MAPSTPVSVFGVVCPPAAGFAGSMSLAPTRPPSAPPPNGGNGGGRQSNPEGIPRPGASERTTSSIITSGNLRATPFPRLLSYLTKKKLNGRVDIELPGNHTIVYFRGGWAAHVAMEQSEGTRLGEILVQEGLDHAKYIESLAIFLQHGNKKRHGQILREMDFIDFKQMGQGLFNQLWKRLLHIFEVTDGAFVVAQEEHEWGQGENEGVWADPLWAITLGLRSYYPAERLHQQVARIWDLPVRLKPICKRELFERFGGPAAGKGLEHKLVSVDELAARFGWTPVERGAAQMLSNGFSVPSQMSLKSDLSEREMCALVMAFWTCNMLEFGEGVSLTPPLGERQRPAGRTPVANPVDPAPGRTGNTPVRPVPGRTGNTPVATIPGRSGSTPVGSAGSRTTGRTSAERLRDLIERKHSSLEGADHFTVLEIERASKVEAALDAYKRLAHIYNLENFKRQGLDENLKPKLEEIMRRLVEAYKTLGDLKKRQEYLARPENARPAQDDAHAPGLAQRLVNAELAFRMGRDSFGRKDYDMAEAKFREALDLNPEEGQHRAYLAWAMFSNPKREKTFAFLDDCYRQLFKACDDSRQSAVSFYFLGRLLNALAEEYKKHKNEEMMNRHLHEALGAFKTALLLDPKNKYAESEARLLTQRLSGKRGTQAYRQVRDRDLPKKRR